MMIHEEEPRLRHQTGPLNLNNYLMVLAFWGIVAAIVHQFI